MISVEAGTSCEGCNWHKLAKDLGTEEEGLRAVLTDEGYSEEDIK